MRRTAAVFALPVALAALVTPAGAAPRDALAPAHPAGLPTPITAANARTALATLLVAEPHSMRGYSREKFPHWATQDHGCDTREVVLARDGQDVQRDDQCRATSGSWYSEYDGRTLTAASQVDIDHFVSPPATLSAVIPAVQKVSGIAVTVLDVGVVQPFGA
ncbi:hypothetical protein AB0J63_48520 [Streptosporangium canum]|uniref:hypothetical protein n=1 Tax=Streptosporangium canum TaxID=324952 RepID=UPI00343D82AB